MEPESLTTAKGLRRSISAQSLQGGALTMKSITETSGGQEVCKVVIME